MTQRDFRTFPNFKFASMASTRCHAAVTPSTWPCEICASREGAAAVSRRHRSTQVKPVCMGFEDFYAGWAPETPPGFTVSPIQGRMERRGGEPSVFDIEVQSDGAISASRRVAVVSLC